MALPLDHPDLFTISWIIAEISDVLSSDPAVPPDQVGGFQFADEEVLVLEDAL